MDTYENLSHVSGIAALIDHTLLKPEATRSDVLRVCAEAREHSFATVCLNPFWVPLAARELRGSQTKVATVVGFPLGANQTDTKIQEAMQALASGAAELDMVQNIGALRSGDNQFVRDEIAAIASLAHSRGALLKVILETSLLDTEQKRRACALALEAKADFVKTSTGFSSAGAIAEDVRLMRAAVGSATGVKASGGIRSLAFLREMVAAGATRIGTSSGVGILRELAEGGGERAANPPSNQAQSESRGY